MGKREKEGGAGGASLPAGDRGWINQSIRRGHICRWQRRPLTPLATASNRSLYSLCSLCSLCSLPFAPLRFAHAPLEQVGSLAFRTIATPCHTAGHVCFYLDGDGDGEGRPPAVFTGDTMFVGGCGNFNSGTPAQMYAALCVKLNALPGDTEVFVGHEYTRRNLAFAATVEPDNAALLAKLEWAGGAEQTVPTTIASERATNPFVRATEPAVQDYVRRMFPDEKWDGIDAAEAVGVQTLRLVRRAKDEWGQTH